MAKKTEEYREGSFRGVIGPIMAVRVTIRNRALSIADRVESNQIVGISAWFKICSILLNYQFLISSRMPGFKDG